jgi:TolB-like protein
MRSLALAAALAAALPVAASAQAKPKIAVLDFATVGASKELASAAGGVVANELDRMGAFQVITSDAIRSMLAFEKQRQMLGCADAGCIAEIGGALGVDYLISGKVTKLAAAGGVPETLNLDLTLTSVRKAQREGSMIESARAERELVEKAGKAARKLVAKVLSGRTGRLVVSAAESGAVVKVDDQVRGTTPLRGAIAVPAGLHTLAVEKQGFVAYQKDVQVEAGKLVEEQVTMVPSPDFVKAYESRQRKLRAGAWISTSAAVAGLATAVALQWSANSLYGNETTPGTFLYDRAKLQAGVEKIGSLDLRAEASSLKSQIETRQTWSYVAGGVGGVAAIAATYFWIAGEDPRRYSRFGEATARIDVAPMPGGALAAVTVGF